MAAILADDNFKCILLNENDRITIRISVKFVPRSPIDNRPALVQVMARQAVTLTDADPVHWRIYAALGGDELKKYTYVVMNIIVWCRYNKVCLI